MSLLQILKGWLFIALAAAALYLMALAMERRHGHLVKPPDEMTATDAQVQTNAPEGQTASESGGLPENGAPSVAKTDTVQDSQNEEAVKRDIETGPLVTTQQAPPTPQETQETEAAPTARQEPETEALPEEEAPEKVILPEATSFTEPMAEPEANTAGKTVTTSEAAADLPETVAPTQLNCLLILSPNGELHRATQYDPIQQMLVWKDLSGLQVHALTDGKVVRVFDSPYTGRTVYQHSRDGRFCVVYGHLEKLDTQIREGHELTCNTAFAFTGSGRPGTDFSIQVMAIPEDASWWQGQSVDLTNLLPDWLPPEPDPEEDP